MRIIKYTYVDVHYNENEQKSADQIMKYLKRLGYNLEVRDDGGHHDFCDQYMKYAKILNDERQPANQVEMLTAIIMEILIIITNINKPQIVSKMPDTVICYIHCQAQLIMNKALLKRIEELFTEKLQAKTGWGRNEILAAYKEAVSEAILEMLDT